MKKFISMVMAAAMVVSLVPATAFAKGDEKATASIVDVAELKKGESKVYDGQDGPELILKMTEVSNQDTTKGKLPSFDVNLTLDNAEWNLPKTGEVAWLKGLISAKDSDGNSRYQGTVGTQSGSAATLNNEITFTSESITAGSWTQAQLDKAMAEFDGIVKNSDVDQFRSWDTIEKKFVKPAVSTEEKVEKYLKKGYVETELADGSVKLVLGNNVDSVLYKDATGKVVADFAPTAAVTMLDAVNEYRTWTHLADYVPAGQDAETVDKAFVVEVKDFGEDFVDYTIKYDPKKIDEGSKFYFNLKADLTKTSVGTKGMVSVDGVVVADDLVYATILGEGLKASIKKVENVAEEEKVELYKSGLKLTSNVGDFEKGQEITMKISKGFEFVKGAAITVDGNKGTVVRTDDNELTLTVGSNAGDEIVIKGIKVEATSAKSGATATITVKSNNWDSATVEVVKVVDYKVELSVDEDEDVPVIYAGVNVENEGITDDSDHLSLEVTAKETFPGAWSMRKGFNFELPEGVYVTNVDVVSTENFVKTINDDKEPATDKDWTDAFINAYQDGKHVNFEFEKRVFDDVNTELEKDPAEVVFQLELVAEPTFSGDVKLKFTGDLVDEQEVVIAKFVPTYTVKAEKNDLKIDSRQTEIPTAITITEAEAGLWEKNAKFTFSIDRGDVINFEDDATFEVDKDSEMEIDDFTNEKDGVIGFTVDDESDEAATVTIKDMKLFMQRNIPAGAYDLKLNTSMEKAFLAQTLFAPDCGDAECDGDCKDKDDDCIVDDVDDYSEVVKEGFVNVVTAPRDQDDSSFTTKVVVPVGEKYIVAGDKQVALDVPAYINAAGYTMLPVRAVATSLGINNDNVLWSQATRTVTILYGQRIITMTAGEKVIHVNGSALPAYSAVEIKDGRTFVVLRDLATALGVTDVSWDAATKTATLNGNQGK